MSRILAVLSVSSLLLGSACDRNDPTIPTTTERPPRLSYAYARIEGSIVIKEDAYSGPVLLTCPTSALAAVANGGRYSLMVKLEVPSGDTFAACRVDVGQPVQATESFDLTLSERIDSLQTTKVDIVVLPDAPPHERMELPIRSVSAAAGHTCAVSATGAVYCWGLNSGAELGFGSHLPTLHPARVVWNQTAVQVVTSGFGQRYDGQGPIRSPASCALKADGAVYCWGDAMLSSFDSTVTPKDAGFPQRISAVSPFTRLEGGAARPCGITASNELFCLGAVTHHSDFPPGKVKIPAVVDIASSQSHRCALTKDGKWHCWGNNEWGQRGDTTTAHTFKRIAAGNNFTCALDQQGNAYCWGRNNVGQLGRSMVTPECGSRMCPGTDVSPQRVATNVRFTEIDAGAGHVCALAENGLLYCWGDGWDGKLGNYGYETFRSDPVIVALNDPLRFTQFSVGEDHACGIATDGKLYCWGQGEDGQLGTGIAGDQNRPTAVWGQE